MPPDARYPSPPDQLYELALQAKRDGLGFDDFWRRATRFGIPPLVTTATRRPPRGAILWPSDSGDRQLWQAAVRQSEEGWRRAYEGRAASTAEKALGRLAPVLARFRAAAAA